MAKRIRSVIDIVLNDSDENKNFTLQILVWNCSQLLAVQIQCSIIWLAFKF